MLSFFLEDGVMFAFYLFLELDAAIRCTQAGRSLKLLNARLDPYSSQSSYNPTKTPHV